ncbi:MAG: glycosyltransferase [Chitinophagaceae bacterium]
MNAPGKTLDVIIPSLRFDTNADHILRILSLSQPPGWTVRYYLIGDSPVALLPQRLEQRINHPDIHFHRNDRNRGLSFSRNKGIELSSGELILFLDDDVTPCADLLLQYTRAAEDHPEAAGFGGVVQLPSPHNDFTRALVLAGYTHFFTLASRRQVLPWAVGGNMMYRRRKIGAARFSTDFGINGGEEVDFAAQVQKLSGTGIVAVPGAILQHPWWNNGKPDFSRPVRYSRGNYFLLKKHPGFSVWRFCNTPEIVFLLLLFTPWVMRAGVNGLRWIGLLAGLMAGDLVFHSLKIIREKRSPSVKRIWYCWLVKMAEQTGFLLFCLRHFYTGDIQTV